MKKKGFTILLGSAIARNVVDYDPQGINDEALA
jgi:hypothetical protein